MNMTAAYDAFLAPVGQFLGSDNPCFDQKHRVALQYASDGTDSDEDVLMMNCSGLLGEEVGGALLLPSPEHPSFAGYSPSTPADFTFKPLRSPSSADTTPAKVTCASTFRSSPAPAQGIATSFLSSLASKASLTSCASPALSTETNFVGFASSDTAQSIPPTLLTRCNTPVSVHSDALTAAAAVQPQAGLMRVCVVRRPALLGCSRGDVCLPAMSGTTTAFGSGMTFAKLGSASLTPSPCPSPLPLPTLSPSPSPPGLDALPVTAHVEVDVAGSLGSTNAPRQELTADASQVLFDALRASGRAVTLRAITPVPTSCAEPQTASLARVDRPRHVYSSGLGPGAGPVEASPSESVGAAAVGAAAVASVRPAAPSAALVRAVAVRRKRGLPFVAGLDVPPAAPAFGLVGPDTVHAVSSDGSAGVGSHPSGCSKRARRSTASYSQHA